MTEALIKLSDGLAAAVETAGLSVVRVDGRRRMAASGVVWSADGVIITANHVLQRDEGITVGLADGQTLPAAIVGRDPTTDLALLRLAGDDVSLRPADWIEPADLRVGQLVLALGRPGRTVQATLGVVGALDDGWRTAAGGVVDRYLHTDVVMYPGFSGGPLVDVAGRMIGLNSSALLRGVSPALPAPTLRRVAETLLAHGRVRRGYLGVTTQRVRLPEGLSGQLGQETGLLVASVEGDSPAERGGLFLGDTVVAVAGRPVRHHDDLLAQLSGDRIGQLLTVRIVRGGKVEEVQVEVGERP